MNRKLFPTLLAAAIFATAMPAASALTPDADGDRIPDNAEIVCSSGAVEAVIDTAGQGRIWCDDQAGIDYNLQEEVTVVEDVVSSDDNDNDGFPATVTIYLRTYTFDPKDAAVLTPGARSSIVQTVDAQDANPNFPVQSQFVLARDVPVGATPGEDPDNDGLPTSVTITQWDITFDRRVVPQVGHENEDTSTHNVDPAPNSAPTDGIDGDRDRVLDAAEPTLCFAEFSDLPQDGSCPTPTDYVAPGPEDLLPPLDTDEIIEIVDGVVDDVFLKLHRLGIHIQRPDILDL